MADVLAAAIYSRICLSIYFAVRARRVRVSGGSKFHLEPGTIPGQYFVRFSMVSFQNIFVLVLNIPILSEP